MGHGREMAPPPRALLPPPAPDAAPVRGAAVAPAARAAVGGAHGHVGRPQELRTHVQGLALAGRAAGVLAPLDDGPFVLERRFGLGEVQAGEARGGEAQGARAARAAALPGCGAALGARQAGRPRADGDAAVGAAARGSGGALRRRGRVQQDGRGVAGDGQALDQAAGLGAVQGGRVSRPLQRPPRRLHRLPGGSARAVAPAALCPQAPPLHLPGGHRARSGRGGHRRLRRGRAEGLRRGRRARADRGRARRGRERRGGHRGFGRNFQARARGFSSSRSRLRRLEALPVRPLALGHVPLARLGQRHGHVPAGPGQSPARPMRGRVAHADHGQAVVGPRGGSPSEQQRGRRPAAVVSGASRPERGRRWRAKPRGRGRVLFARRDGESLSPVEPGRRHDADPHGPQGHRAPGLEPQEG
mmetsp:Transcript_13262/g.31380  ORF Transcript_13262/g.31380 Transcript_13262/m.31380 type:complete len:416 (-) Transcript_13262:2516-3763(-)